MRNFLSDNIGIAVCTLLSYLPKLQTARFRQSVQLQSTDAITVFQGSFTNYSTFDFGTIMSIRVNTLSVKKFFVYLFPVRYVTGYNSCLTHSLEK